MEERQVSALDKIIAEELNSGRAVPSDILAVRDTTPGVTDALYVNNVLSALGDTYPWVTGALERNKTAKVPTLKKVLETLGYTDDKDAKDGKGRTAVDKFIEDFVKDMNDRPDREGNKNKILGTPELGERGWETVKKLWQQASHDRMLQDIGQARKDALEGGAGATLPFIGTELPRPVSKVLGSVSGTAGNIFTPRTRQAWEEGRDASWRDAGMDAFQNLAYAAPMGGVGAGVSRLLGGSLLARGAAGVASNAVAPAAIAAGDYALGTKDYAGPGDAALDATLGTAVNAGMNRWLMPRLSTLLTAGSARVPRLQAVINFLEGSKTDSQKAKDLIRNAETKVEKHFGETDSQFLQKLRDGKTPDRLPDDVLKDYIDILNARDVLGEKATVDKFKGALKSMREGEKAVGDYNPASGIRTKTLREVDDLYPTQNRKRSVESIIDQALGKVGYKTPEEVSAWDIGEFVADKGGNPVASAARALKAHPELISQYDRPSFAEWLKMPTTKMDIARSWTVNRLGRDEAASRLASRFDIDVGDTRKWQEGQRKAKAARADISKVLKAGAAELDERDERFLKDVADDPTIMTTGHPTDPEGFKLWLLERGHGLLSGTAAARPAWEVE